MSSTPPNRLAWPVRRATIPSTVSSSRPTRSTATPASWTAGDPRYSASMLASSSGNRDNVIQVADMLDSPIALGHDRRGPSSTRDPARAAHPPLESTPPVRWTLLALPALLAAAPLQAQAWAG